MPALCLGNAFLLTRSCGHLYRAIPLALAGSHSQNRIDSGANQRYRYNPAFSIIYLAHAYFFSDDGFHTITIGQQKSAAPGAEYTTGIYVP